ncbi:MAG: histidinol-phosphate transaminase [Proteobacteria bacterium]|nr:histidinol-phosphate transaminase [Pseudomonadota bacterium]MBU4469547.1 histidinol-phosphate transaminase [Pseudomonadota bacterium]MCG2753225.1 histidinol-phosphate transaminase [Desulfobacteraceae bacterium]
MKLKIPESILEIDPYVPGKPIEELEREYGIRDSIKLASNENPLGPSPKAVEAVSKALLNLHRYPDGSGHDLIGKLADRVGVKPENIVIGNGSDDIIGILATTFLRPGDEAVMPRPSFLMYDIAVKCMGAKPIAVPLKNLSMDLDAMAKAVTGKTRLVFICNPNNPTGTCVSEEALESFVKQLPEHVITVVDEAYIEFARDLECGSVIKMVKDYPVAALRTFSKVYGLAGLRVGYGVMPAEMAGLVNRVRHPFNVNTLAQAGALAALEDVDYVQMTLKLVHEGLDFMFASLKEMGIKCFPTQTNFFLIDMGRNADEVYRQMLKEGVIVRSMTSYGYPEYIRITVGLPEENQRLLAALKKIRG